jgi:hypothetical protein
MFSVGFDITDQLLITFIAIVGYWEYNETVHTLFIDFKKACDPVRRGVKGKVVLVLN